MDIELTPDRIVIHCEAQLDRETVLEQQRLLLQALELKKPVTLIASSLIHVDTAGIQFLINFIKSLRTLEIPWKWENVSPTLRELATLLGALQLMQLPNEEKA